MASLVNDMILRTGIIQTIAGDKGVQWFKGITTAEVIGTILFPILVCICVAFMLKKRYDNYRRKLDLGIYDDIYDDDNFLN